MNSKQKNRLFWITIMFLGVSITVGLVLFALNRNINLYYTPSQLEGQLNTRHLRLGGLVKQGTVKRVSNTLTIHFVITDFKRDIPIVYTGIVPALFREGQGVVVEGQFDRVGMFVANQVLAKHDEKYMPPGIHQN